MAAPTAWCAATTSPTTSWCSTGRRPFTLTATLNSQADDDDALEFPVNLTSVTVVVKQASGGIVTPPTGGEVEHYDYVTTANTNVSRPSIRVSRSASKSGTTYDLAYQAHR